MIRGSCCCGAVKFELSAPPRMMGACHCSRCRKAGASIFVFVRRETFRWTAGEALVATYEPQAPFKHSRRFCRQCGSSLGEAGGDAEAFPIAADCLDDDPGVRVRFHEFVGEKPAWYEIADAATRFEGHPTRS